MNVNSQRRDDDPIYDLSSPKMGPRRRQPTAEDEPLLQPFKASENKLVFLAEHGYVLAGGTLFFLLGTMVSLVIVWIIILICNRQIAVERITSQAKVAAVYGEFSGRSQAIKKPYVDLTKLFNCSTHSNTLQAENRLTEIQTAFALAYEAGMKFVQDMVDKTAYSGLFTGIFTAAIIMLLIEILCIVVFLAYKNNWRGFQDATKGSGGTNYSFLIQGPKVLHHGIFEVTNSLSQAGLQVKTLINRASESLCPQNTDNTYCPTTTTEMTISVQPQQQGTSLSPVQEVDEEDDALLEGAQDRPRHPLTYHPFRPPGSMPVDSDYWKTVATETTPTVEDLGSDSVGLQTLREHLERCRLLVPDFPDLETTNGSVQPDRDSIANNVELTSEERLSMMIRPSPSEEMRRSGKLPSQQADQFRQSTDGRPVDRTSTGASRNFSTGSSKRADSNPSTDRTQSLKVDPEKSRRSGPLSLSDQINPRISAPGIPHEWEDLREPSVARPKQSGKVSGLPEQRQLSVEQRSSASQRQPDKRFIEKPKLSGNVISTERTLSVPMRASADKQVTPGSLSLGVRKSNSERPSQGTKSVLKSPDDRPSLKEKKNPSLGVTFATDLPDRGPESNSAGTNDDTSVRTPRIPSPVWVDPDATPVVINADHEESDPDMSANSEKLAELVDKENFEDDRT